jgi:hypothetical protein
MALSNLSVKVVSTMLLNIATRTRTNLKRIKTKRRRSLSLPTTQATLAMCKRRRITNTTVRCYNNTPRATSLNLTVKMVLPLNQKQAVRLMSIPHSLVVLDNLAEVAEAGIEEGVVVVGGATAVVVLPPLEVETILLYHREAVAAELVVAVVVGAVVEVEEGVDVAEGENSIMTRRISLPQTMQMVTLLLDVVAAVEAEGEEEKDEDVGDGIVVEERATLVVDGIPQAAIIPIKNRAPLHQSPNSAMKLEQTS